MARQSDVTSGRGLLRQLRESRALADKDSTREVRVLLAESQKQNRLQDKGLKDALALYDSFVAWSINLSTLLNFRAADSKIEGDTSYRVLSGAITSLLISVRILVLAGHDVAAKQVVRSLSEHCDVLLLLITHPELAGEFATPNEWEKSNEFWHRHVKGDKARDKVFKQLVKISRGDSNWYIEWRAWRKTEDTVLSLSAHPSYIGAVMATWPLALSSDEQSFSEEPIRWPGFLGHVSSVSVRTLTYAMHSVALIAGVRSFPFDSTSKLGALVQYQDDDGMCQQVEQEREILMDILERI